MLTMLTGDTILDLSPYEEQDDEQTMRVEMTKSDAVYEAHEKLRAGNHEAAGVWFLVAGSL